MKLFTKAQREKLLANGTRRGADHKARRAPVQPHGNRYLAADRTRSGPPRRLRDSAWPIWEWASRNWAISAVREISEFRGLMGLGIERDLYFRPRHAISDVRRSRAGRRPHRRTRTRTRRRRRAKPGREHRRRLTAFPTPFHRPVPASTRGGAFSFPTRPGRPRMTPLDAPEPGFRDMPLLDMPAPPAPDRSPGQAPVREADSHRRLQARFLRAGREAVDDRELLELLLSGRHAGHRRSCNRRQPARHLRHRAARPRRSARPPPDRSRPLRGRHRRHQDRRGPRHQHGPGGRSGNRPPVLRQLFEGHRLLPHARRTPRRGGIPRSVSGSEEPAHRRRVCINGAPSATRRPIPGRSAYVVWSFRPARSSPVHDHPTGDPEASRADIDMTRRIRDALKTIEVTLLDHVIVTPTASLSFQERGLL